jgi:hypothetical protein
MLGSIARRSVVLSSRRSATRTRELRNLRRAGRSPSSISARTPTRTVSVSHPTLGGLTERVERVVDTLDSMLKAGPRHLDVRQWQAAQIFRSAYEVLEGAVGNVMDFDRIRGAGLPGSPPPPRQLFAADRINEARGLLYAGDYMIISCVAGRLSRFYHEIAGVGLVFPRADRPIAVEYVGYPVITPPPRPLDGGRGHRGVSGTLRPIEGLEFV